MKDFKGGDRYSNNRGGGDRFGGRNDRGGRGGFGGGNRGGRDFGGDKQMFKTICAECGKSCEVPFKPNGEKPVYCSDCFGKNAGGQFGDRNNDRAPRKEYSAPKTFNTTTYDSGSLDMKKSLDAMNTKLDTLISLLTPKTPVTKTEIAPKTATLTQVVAKAISKTTEKSPAKKTATTKTVAKKAVKTVAKKVAKKVTKKTK